MFDKKSLWVYIHNILIYKRSYLLVINIINNMPRMDGTGPRGEGRGTGRRLGNCRNVNDRQDFSRMGDGFGRFNRNNLIKTELKDTLQKEKEEIEKQLEELEK